VIFEKIKSTVVSHLSYFIASDGEAMVVDPQRDCRVYVDIAQREGCGIKYVFETHRNEDYVIGSMELSAMTGAAIYHGPWPEYRYGEKLVGGQTFRLGKLKVTAIHTPGHTPGCMSYAVADMATGGETVLVCTGDVLFVNDVGRTDFGGPDKRREWSENLYNSIHGKLLPLGDHVVLCPAHGSGSVCGSGIAARELSTLGAERLMNPLLQLSKEEFIERKVKERHHYMPYFKMMEKLNVEGAPPVGSGPNPPPLTPKAVQGMVSAGAVVVDTRPPPSFGAGHIVGSYSLPRARLGFGGFVLPYDKPIILVLGDQSHLDPVARSLMRMGYDNVEGYLGGTIASWYREALPVSTLPLMTVTDLKEKLGGGPDWLVLDVRSEEEYSRGHIEGSVNLYAGTLAEHSGEVPRDQTVAVICKTGTRSSFACSVLLRLGFKNVHNVLGGMEAWSLKGYLTVKEDASPYYRNKLR
jgi:hydroxyacylglutathione hydrolase